MRLTASPTRAVGLSRSNGRCLCLVAACLLWASLLGTVSAGPLATQTAERVDHLIEQELFSPTTDLAPLTDDATFLRRVTVDLTGTIPTPQEIQSFLSDDSARKRDNMVRELLERPAYGENWAHYFRDVILYRRVEERAALVSDSLVALLAEKLNDNVGWDSIAHEFVTAQGDVRENGATAIIMAQDGRTEETVAEISRIFLGIQIQCAQCHNHPYDRWQREQFHQLAAFFPRIGVRQVRDSQPRSFEVFAVDRKRPQRQRPNNDRAPTPEHYMPDLDDPAALGTLMTPRFFLTDQELPLGSTDSDRRQALADWITSNEWFATAVVNRIWAELVGEGFYEPIDDLGPDRTALAPKALHLLAGDFSRSGYDLKWLFRTICATDAYQRQSRPRRESDGTAFAANVAQPLRADQLFDAVLAALSVEEGALLRGGRGGRRGGSGRGGRTIFSGTFGYDPSDPREEIGSTIPQVLALMNSPLFAARAGGRARQSPLARLVDPTGSGHEAIINALYLRCLSREASADEQSVISGYVGAAKNRREAYEDVLWALVNSAEFRYRK